MIDYIEITENKINNINKIYKTMYSLMMPINKRDFFSLNLKNELLKLNTDNEEVFKLQFTLLSNKIYLEFEELKYQLGYESYIKNEKLNIIIFLMSIGYFYLFILNIDKNIYASILYCLIGSFGLIFSFKKLSHSYTFITSKKIKQLRKEIKKQNENT